MSTATLDGGALHVPEIDLTPFVDGGSDEDRRRVVAEVDRAAREVGFLQVVGHGVPQVTLEALTSAMDAFFGIDAELKAAYRRPAGVNRGYSPPRSERLANSLGLASAADLFEAFTLGTTTEDFPGQPEASYPSNELPGEPAGFEAAVLAWFGEAARVARTMTQIFALALDLPDDHFARLAEHSIDTLRLISYRLPADDVIGLEPDQRGMGAHTDYGIVTVLWADAVPGLEVLGADGSFHGVAPAEGALLVNLGDALARWTNDRWISTMHRVAAPVVAGRLVPRRSAAFFHDGDVDAVIACLPNLLAPGEEPIYPPVTVGEHLHAKLAGSRGGTLMSGAEREASRLARL